MIKEKHLCNKTYGGHQLARYIDVYEVSTIDCAATQYSGYKGTEITLIDQTPAGSGFDHWNITGATLTGNNFILNNDVTAQGIYTALPVVRNLTLQTDGHGTINATKITGYAGDTVTLTNSYDTYYRFSGYTQTGGSLNGSIFTFSNSDATAKAWFKANTFKVSGDFVLPTGSYTGVANFIKNTGPWYAKAPTAVTGNIPTAWTANNRWQPTNTNSYSAAYSGNGAIIQKKERCKLVMNLYAGNTIIKTRDNPSIGMGMGGVTSNVDGLNYMSGYWQGTGTGTQTGQGIFYADGSECLHYVASGLAP